jgi:hypothetical protein
VRSSNLAAIAFLLAASPAAAQPLIFSGDVEGHLGYAVNPKLTSGRDDGAGYGGFRFNPQLSQSDALSKTVLSVAYQREQYFSAFGHTQSISAKMSHDRTLSEHLKGGLQASYQRSNNLLLSSDVDPSELDNFSGGRTTESMRGSASLAWQASARDTIDMSGFYQHQKSESRGVAQEYDLYGGNLGYLHTLSARTVVGVRASISKYSTGVATLADSTSIAPTLVLQQRLNAVWRLEADVGVSFQRQGAPANTTNKGLSFHLSLCGTYPRSTLCIVASRQTTASAFGGLRQQLSGAVNYSYRLTERSTVSLQGTYVDSKANRFDTVSSSEIFRGEIDYNRALSRRLSAGVEARGGYRKSATFGSAHSLAASAYLRLKIGRVS